MWIWFEIVVKNVVKLMWMWCELVVKLLWMWCEIALKCMWIWCGIDVKLVWNCCDIVVSSLWNYESKSSPQPPYRPWGGLIGIYIYIYIYVCGFTEPTFSNNKLLSKNWKSQAASFLTLQAPTSLPNPFKSYYYYFYTYTHTYIYIYIYIYTRVGLSL